MQFLPDVYVRRGLQGQALQPAKREIHYKGRSIGRLSDRDDRGGAAFFSRCPRSVPSSKTLKSVGLGYVHLGPAGYHLSGRRGAARQAGTELSRKGHRQDGVRPGRPTTGLTWRTGEAAPGLHRLVDAGNTVWSSSTNLDVVKRPTGSWNLGPEGGSAAATSSPRHAGEVAQAPGSPPARPLPASCGRAARAPSAVTFRDPGGARRSGAQVGPAVAFLPPPGKRAAAAGSRPDLSGDYPPARLPRWPGRWPLVELLHRPRTQPAWRPCERYALPHPAFESSDLFGDGGPERCRSCSRGARRSARLRRVDPYLRSAGCMCTAGPESPAEVVIVVLTTLRRLVDPAAALELRQSGRGHGP